jgi:hypothetical protein
MPVNLHVRNVDDDIALTADARLPGKKAMTDLAIGVVLLTESAALLETMR